MSKLRKGTISLADANPELAKEWDYEKNAPLTPDNIARAANRKVWWKCPKGHSWEASINNRASNSRGCPFCAGSRVLEGYNDFNTWCLSNGFTKLLQEWNYERNTVNPSEVTAKSNKKIWWKCSLGHEWDASINSRTAGRPSGCPYCSNPPKRILVGFNDFETWCLNNNKAYLLKEWNTKRNTNITPQELTYGSGKKIWWKCDRGHEWSVSPSCRVRGSGCPVCSRTQTSFPEQAIAFYLSKSFNVLQRYSVNGFELDVYLEEYRIGIEYDGMFYHTKEKYKRENDKNIFYRNNGIRLIRVKESKEKTGTESDTIYYFPAKTNYLDDSFNKMLLALINLIETYTGVSINKDVDIVRDELLVREHYASIIKSNSVAAIFPELVAEWDVEKNNGMTPEHFSANAHTKVWWKCKNGHSWQADISSRNRKLGCPYCAGQRTIDGVNDFETWCIENNPVLLKEWNYFRNEMLPSEIQKTSNQKVWWFCSKGHEWEASVANRVHGTGCPICNTGNNVKRNSVSLAEWCRETKQEQLLSEWNYDKNALLTPDTVSKGSHIKVWWKCSEGHEWEAQIKSRTYNHGCPYCSGTYKKSIIGKNDLITWCKDNDKQYILDEWDYDNNDGLTPEQFTFGSHKRINWKCKNGHKWNAVIKERTKYRGNKCPVCNKDNKKTITGSKTS